MRNNTTMLMKSKRKTGGTRLWVSDHSTTVEMRPKDRGVDNGIQSTAMGFLGLPIREQTGYFVDGVIWILGFWVFHYRFKKEESRP